jgi:hypothetical protein
VIRIESRPTEHLSLKVQSDVIAEIDRAAVRLKVIRSAVVRALIDSALEEFRRSYQLTSQ